MCGVAGFLGSGGVGPDEWPSLLNRMGAAIAHRGPDSCGIWTDADAGIGLAHRRLAVVDLSPAGRQPMISPSGRFVIIFNGEIYNHVELRMELDAALEKKSQSIGWRGHSDTETLLAGFDVWGVETTLKRSVGMFAIALWDKQRRELVLARDRMGEKPLYYGWCNGVFLFGSELKVIKAHPAFRGEIDRDAVALLLKHSYIPAPYSIYKGVRKLKPGMLLRVTASSAAFDDPVVYWSFCEAAESALANPFTGSDSEAVEALEALLRRSVSNQMLADVPLGAFLSGGVDSSTVVALMQAQSSQPIKTFTIGFDESAYNEAKYARAVAKHLGTQHTELYVSPKRAMEVIPLLPALYDEPFSDSSQIPTYLVSQMARKHVTVSLSGDAGDELFGGYTRYLLARTLWAWAGKLPGPARCKVASFLSAASPSFWDKIYEKASHILPQRFRSTHFGHKIHKLAEIFSATSADDIYDGLISHWRRPTDTVMGATESPSLMSLLKKADSFESFEDRMMAADSLSYLPDDILVKVDRAAMGVSLETRVPFLDHRVLEFAWRLPLRMKMRKGESKWILRQVLYKHVPPDLIERPKMGFGVPIDDWLRGPLRDWAEGLLNEQRLRREGYFYAEPIRRKWDEHQSGQHNWQYHLWDVLMFQAWLERES
ncbi:asparagine synthase (glutamine-hydrolyzing) [Methylocapsa acidiphila]|uniref:asparagine synthase (glutamine-hydrolyzing) n=1 Tax=Methylocapsa acidiphila TaxID=133552 RepID=UPI00040040B5|nr:asparagine synthase (glutamine-hydrolyzing) [Methylocapsa acidiphila]